MHGTQVNIHTHTLTLVCGLRRVESKCSRLRSHTSPNNEIQSVATSQCNESLSFSRERFLLERFSAFRFICSAFIFLINTFTHWHAKSTAIHHTRILKGLIVMKFSCTSKSLYSLMRLINWIYDWIFLEIHELQLDNSLKSDNMIHWYGRNYELIRRDITSDEDK